MVRAEGSIGMGKTGLLAVITVILLLARALPAVGDPAVETPAQAAQASPRFELASLEQFDMFVAGRKQMAWGMHEQSENFGPDIAGRTLAQNADEYIFTPQADAELLALRAKAGEQAAAGDQAGLATTLRAAEEFAYRMLILADLLGRWHSTSDAVSAQEAALRPVMEKSPEPERQATRARIDPLLLEMRRLLAEAVVVKRVDDFPKASVGVRKTNDALFDAYNEERVRLVPFAEEWDRKHGNAPLSWKRSAPCEAREATPAPTSEPTIDQSSLTLPDFPVDARRGAFEGSVQIRAEVSATGCPERVEIHRSVGYTPLDIAALTWAQGIRFRPGMVDGKPKASTVVFATTFRLHD
jgi:TonB family protein